ncbi:aldehyde dehydrogenase (NAD+) [Chitinophaga costaii]|uniref:Aldehyde dehydrogenase n=1 Tax=Chitinophaga costaii TaxID=1335309 RepID=A0A1C4F2F9_9BACT|nr:aldehyde dehydrogenase family protein [Chitinophaga costaii]PUZ22125.1 aldehyde dehydrogenase family protein [Chitinophaga costaii]SCC50034.1 aldehyde dehydrogenase (NAD+) [Chitinophaga costaii]
MNTLEKVAVEDVFHQQQQHVAKQKLTTARERIALLTKLKNALPAVKDKLVEALAKDVGKPAFEVGYMEIAGLAAAIDQTCASLETWMQSETRPSAIDPKANIEIRPEARGVVLVIGPWNVPFLLALEPTVAALAAGNCVMIKPSELTPHTSKVIKEFIPTVFAPEVVSVVEGGVEETTTLLQLPFDHIFFTGSPNVGKVVMAAASKNLTTVTLELGGKSPVFIDKSADLKRAATAIMHKKIINGGQICIAPDYILIPEDIEYAFVAELQKAAQRLLYNNGKFTGGDMSHVINQRNYDRLKGLFNDAVSKGAKVAFGGTFHDDVNQIEPTVLINVPLDSKIMQEEIFGPLLPIIHYKDLQEAIDYVNKGSKPLALYIFSKENKAIEQIVAQTTSGGVTVNEAMLHVFDPTVPFGGVNGSGMGAYHGIYGFRELSHLKTIYYASDAPLDETLYPPFDKKQKN